jgi:hypothetical protein
MKMVCKSVYESMDDWKFYIEQAQERDADNAINELVMLRRSFLRKSKATADRLQRLIAVGISVYERRFNCIWVPF